MDSLPRERAYAIHRESVQLQMFDIIEEMLDRECTEVNWKVDLRDKLKFIGVKKTTCYNILAGRENLSLEIFSDLLYSLGYIFKIALQEQELK